MDAHSQLAMNREPLQADSQEAQTAASGGDSPIALMPTAKEATQGSLMNIQQTSSQEEPLGSSYTDQVLDTGQTIDWFKHMHGCESCSLDKLIRALAKLTSSGSPLLFCEKAKHLLGGPPRHP